MSTHRSLVLGAAGIAFALCFASSASAATLAMSGNWQQQRGVTTFIPLNGAGIPGGGNVTVTGASPAAITLQPGVFQGAGGVAFPLPTNPTVIQVTTNFVFSGPQFPGQLFPGPKGSRPANFAWCPGATANPACTTPASTVTGQGTRNGLVRYAAGTNQFGGTMQMFLTGTGDLAIKVGSHTCGGACAATPKPLALHNFIGGGGGTQAFGGPYGFVDIDALAGGPITAVLGSTPGGLITQPGPQVATGPPSTNVNTGFPWTTGMVTAQVTLVAQANPTTLVATGSDSRTPLGAGNITLVAGGITERGSGAYYASLDTVSMTFTNATIPSLSRGGMALGVVLVVLGAGYGLRRRF
jgi:hypothetical protein